MNMIISGRPSYTEKQNYQPSSSTYRARCPKILDYEAMKAINSQLNDQFEIEAGVLSDKITGNRQEFQRKIGTYQEKCKKGVQELDAIEDKLNAAIKDITFNQQSFQKNMINKFSEDKLLPKTDKLLRQIRQQNENKYQCIESLEKKLQFDRSVMSSNETKNEQCLNQLVSILDICMDDLQGQIQAIENKNEQEYGNIEQKMIQISQKLQQSVREEKQRRAKDDMLIEKLIEKLIDKMAQM